MPEAKESYKGVWIGLGIVAFIIWGVVIISENSSSSANGGQGYNLEHGSFSVYFPDQPTYSSASQELTKGNSVSDDNYSWGSIGNGINNPSLEATHIASAFAGSAASADADLEAELQYTGTSGGSKVVSSSLTTFKGYPAIKYISSNQVDQSQPILYQSGMDVLKGNDLYMLDYFYWEGQEDQQLENTFLSSLSFTTSSNNSAPQSQQNSSPTVQQPQNTSLNASEGLTPSLINQIEPTIVEINCYASNSSVVVSGSGVSFRSNTKNIASTNIDIETNFHVLAEAELASQGGPLPACYAVYPEPPNFGYNEGYGDYKLALIDSHYNPNTYEDAAIFALDTPLPSSVTLSPIPAINNLPEFPHSGCSNVNVGDTVTIFGYPSSGNLLGISETVTQGIISGILPGPIYKTNAAIDHGNSGGVAILNKGPCILGIPTLGESGLTAGIGYIQAYTLAAQSTN